jgi:hypothetical protein
MMPFLVIDTKSGFISRFVGKTRTHKPFQLNAGIGASDERMQFYELARLDPDTAGIDREAVDVH